MTAVAGERSFYLDDYADEVVPCDCTLAGWAAWLPVEDVSWPHDIPADGEAFVGCATLWLDDVVATFDGESWQLSRDPDGDFTAVRFGQGLGWDADSICGDRASVLEFLNDSGPHDAGDTEYVACGMHEGGWRFTFHAGPPPTVSAERLQ